MVYQLLYQTQAGALVVVEIQAATDAQAECAAQHIVPQDAAIVEIELPKAA